MIGCMAGTNDLYFEEGEVEKIRKGLVKGDFINGKPEIKGNLICMVSTQTTELIDAKLVKEEPDVISLAEVFVSEKAYLHLVHSGRYGDHQGNREVNLFDVTKDLPFLEGNMYNQLVHYRDV